MSYSERGRHIAQITPGPPGFHAVRGWRDGRGSIDFWVEPVLLWALVQWEYSADDGWLLDSDVEPLVMDGGACLCPLRETDAATSEGAAFRLVGPSDSIERAKDLIAEQLARASGAA